MRVERLDHFTINAVDIEASRRFYGTFLGLRELDSVDMGDHALYYFRLPGGTRLELITYQEDRGLCRADLLSRGRFRHLAFQVDDLKQATADIERFGGKILQPPKWVEKLNFSGMLALDPNGCELEFISPFPL